MKKVLTILTATIILASGFQISMDRHFCGGNLAGVKISVTGQMASCGMEDPEESYPAGGLLLRTHCCEDIVTVFKIDNNYSPAFSVLTEPINDNLHIYSNAADLIRSYKTTLTLLFTDVSPPGNLMSTDVDLSDICVFRI
jgi:hypothetical protein